MNIQSYYQWWYEDYNPLDGRLRFLFYMLLFYLAYKSLLPNAINRLLACPDSYFEAAGIMQLVFPSGITAGEIGAFLGVLQYVVIFFWLSSAVGLFGRISPFVTGTGVFVFWGSMQSCAGTGHDWHLPMFVLLFLGFFMKNDRWSADYLLARTFRWYPFRDFTPNKYGGFARKLILVTAVFILFAGGIAKLFTGSFAWLNGESLYFYLLEFNEPSPLYGSLLLEFLLSNRWMITVLSIYTILLELGTLIMLFKQRWRFLFVLNLWAFHFGIYLLMFPRYFPSMICYLLIVNWRETFSPVLQRINSFTHKHEVKFSGKKSLKRIPAESTIKKRLIFPSLLLIIFAATILYRIETFPLTYVPMYSTVLTEEKIGRYNRADFTNRSALNNVATMYMNGDQPWYLMFYYPRNIEIRVRYQNPEHSEEEIKDVTEEYTALIQNWPKWFERVTTVTLEDISMGKIFGSDPPDSRAETASLLCEIKNVLIASGGYSAIEEISLVYHFDEQNEEIMLSVSCE